MHELAIAEAIAAIAERQAQGRRVIRVEVEVGRLRQVVPDALAFGFELVTHGTALDGAELALDEIPVRLSCKSCAATTEPDRFPFACEDCGSLDVEVTDGEQLQVVALELEDEPAVLGGR
jgi:hydrogenase nickel incorporation protein HypA/HybF